MCLDWIYECLVVRTSFKYCFIYFYCHRFNEGADVTVGLVADVFGFCSITQNAEVKPCDTSYFLDNCLNPRAMPPGLVCDI
jgi:hypothetical protein